MVNLGNINAYNPLCKPMNEKIKILIVEDECIFSMNLQFMLSDNGYEVTGKATNFYDAVKRAKIDMPDIALMDVYIKGDVTGIDTADHLRKIFGIPSIFITANHDGSMEKKMYDIEPLAVLSKPLDEKKLYAALEKFRERRKLRMDIIA